MNPKIIIYSRFNDADVNLGEIFHIESHSREWISKRIDIFYNYTRKSVENQTNQDYLYVLRTHPDSLKYVEAALKDYPKLNENIIFTASHKDLIKKYIKGSKDFYLAQIDSDDMYHPQYIETLTKTSLQPETSALICKNGYIFNTITKKLCRFYNVSSAVFAQHFLVSEYMNTYQYYPDMSHVKIHLFPHEAFKDNMFMIITHSMNTATNIDKYLKYEIKDPVQKKSILEDFLLLP